jgi:hypothetical protein
MILLILCIYLAGAVPAAYAADAPASEESATLNAGEPGGPADGSPEGYAVELEREESSEQEKEVLGAGAATARSPDTIVMTR